MPRRAALFRGIGTNDTNFIGVSWGFEQYRSGMLSSGVRVYACLFDFLQKLPSELIAVQMANGVLIALLRQLDVYFTECLALATPGKLKSSRNNAVHP